MVDVSWAVEAFPGNATSTVNLNGTVQEIIQQLIEINSEYPVHDISIEGSKNVFPDAAVSTLPDAHLAGQVLEANEKQASTNKVCTDRWPAAKYTEIRNGIRYLRQLTSGKPANGPGPGACSRVSCSYKSAIYWCNDDNDRKELDSWEKVASNAEVVMHLCVWKLDGGVYQTRGQLFDPDGWNVIVRGDSESC